jgi:DNA-binding transcriptional LysR family regulator
MLERNLGVRLFQRSTRKLTLTEAGEAFFNAVGAPLEHLQHAIASVSSDDGQATGTLKISLAPSLGIEYLLPHLPAFLQRHPLVRPEWDFENRSVDLIAEGYDAAIGGGFELANGVVARRLAPLHVVAVASPAYLTQHAPPKTPADLANLPGIALRYLMTGRIRSWTLRNAAGEEAAAPTTETMVINDATAAREAARRGLGIALLAVPDVLACLESGELIRVLPQRWSDAGSLSLYYSSRQHLPAKTRCFIEFVLELFEREDYARRFAANQH